jgi:fatty acid desaturase 6
MFVAPVLLPPVMPLTALYQLMTSRDWKYLVMFLVVMPAGILFHVALLIYVSHFSLTGALLAMWVYRGALAIPYIHINIFQHIGMYNKCILYIIRSF